MLPPLQLLFILLFILIEKDRMKNTRTILRDSLTRPSKIEDKKRYIE